MSKKIKISIPNKERPNLSELFHAYMLRKGKERKDSKHHFYMGGMIWDCDDYDEIMEYWNEVFPGWDDDDSDDDSEVIYPSKDNHSEKNKDYEAYDSFWEYEESMNKRNNGKKKSKHRKHHGKRARLVDINAPYNGEEEEYNLNDIGIIDFTNNHNDDEIKEIWFYFDYHCKDDRQCFSSVAEFKDFCATMGYFLDDDVIADLEWRYESHCCLKPSSESDGFLEITSEDSYGNMFYEVCAEEELSYGQ